MHNRGKSNLFEDAKPMKGLKPMSTNQYLPKPQLVYPYGPGILNSNHSNIIVGGAGTNKMHKFRLNFNSWIINIGILFRP